MSDLTHSPHGLTIVDVVNAYANSRHLGEALTTETDYAGSDPWRDVSNGKIPTVQGIWIIRDSTGQWRLE